MHLFQIQQNQIAALTGSQWIPSLIKSSAKEELSEEAGIDDPAIVSLNISVGDR